MPLPGLGDLSTYAAPLPEAIGCAVRQHRYEATRPLSVAAPQARCTLPSFVTSP